MASPPAPQVPASLLERASNRFELTEPADQGRLIHHLPPKFEGAGDADLGDAERMPAEAVQAWIRRRKAQPEGDSA